MPRQCLSRLMLYALSVLKQAHAVCLVNAVMMPCPCLNRLTLYASSVLEQAHAVCLVSA